jgi:hypothetical protein
MFALGQIIYFTLLAMFALIPPLPGLYGDGAIYNCTKTIYPWVFTVINIGTVAIGTLNLVLFCKYSKKQKELIK